jgi:hypothetical protein
MEKRDNWPKLRMVLKGSEPEIEPVTEPTMQEKIAKSIKLIFSTHWALNTNPPVIRYKDTLYFKQPASGEWVAMWILPSSKFLTGVTKVIERQLGIVMFQIFTTKNLGLPRAQTICDMIYAVFDNQTFTPNSDLKIIFRPLEQKPVGERKGYFQLNATVPFVADYEKRAEQEDQTENPF